MIPYGRQDITEADVAAVTRVLRSDFLTQGPAVDEFEQALVARLGGAHAVAVNSATSALHLACLALDVGPGDRVWTSPNTFVASANCARYCGAEVDFVDIERETLNLCADRLAEKLARAEREGRLPKVVIPVHFAGQPCDMPRIHRLAGRYGFRIVEDASHAIGSRAGAQWIGAGEYSDITVLSFHPVKIVTTAEGGAALTRDAGLAAVMRRLRTHGITRDPAVMGHAPEGPWCYEQLELGFNYRLTDLQAALGTSQLARLDEYVAQRNRLATRYQQLLADFPVSFPTVRKGLVSSYHLFVIELLRADRPRVFAHMRARGIGVNVHYSPVHLQPYYRRLGFQAGYCPSAEAYYARALTLPLFPTMSESDQDRVVAALGEVA